jgi:hypothetical protein
MHLIHFIEVLSLLVESFEGIEHLLVHFRLVELFPHEFKKPLEVSLLPIAIRANPLHHLHVSRVQPKCP